MTIRFRVPGPVGLTASVNQGRTPGPLGFGFGIYAAPQQIGRAIKKLAMPLPAADNRSKNAHAYDRNLYAKKDAPAPEDVEQGGLPNCPLAALLAALAHTPAGRKYVVSLVTEHSALVETELSAVAGELQEPPPGNKIVSNRYFTVKLSKKAIEVSDVFYTSDHDSGYALIYMREPNSVLWPCVIEKAFAQMLGGYGKLDGDKMTVQVFWEAVMASKPDGFAVSQQTSDAKIKEAVQNAPTTPTVAASKNDAKAVTAWHGFTVLGMKGTKIELYDANTTKKLSLTLEEFRANFQAILYGKP